MTNVYSVNKQKHVHFVYCELKPCDFGSINDKPVLNVQRKGAEAHHFILEPETTPPFNVGEVVKCTVDWDRRHDHMQQHSGLTINPINLIKWFTAYLKQ